MNTYLNKLQSESGYKSEEYKIVHQRTDLPLNKLCLFASYSFTGVVEEYVLYYLSAIKKAQYSIAFISTSILQDECIFKLKQTCSLIIERENFGLDFASWQCALKLSNWGQDYEQILLTNDSVFGPFHPLDTIISTMNKRFDVWGMTDNYEIDYHIQSYFVNFNDKVIKSTAWLSFWQNMNTAKASKDELIRRYEVGLSQKMIDAGFKLGVYTSIDTLTRSIGGNDKQISPPLVYWQSLIKKFCFPFLKRELLISTTISKAYWHRNIYINTNNWRRVIAQESEYPVSVIDNFLQKYLEQLTTTNAKIKVRKKKILFVSEGLENSDAQKVLLSFLQWVKNEKSTPFELIFSGKKEDSGLIDEFDKLCPVTFFEDLLESGKNELKERLSNDSIGLIFSDSLTNIEAQKFLLFLTAPQVIYAHDLPTNKTLSTLLEINKIWFRENTTHLIASSPFVKQKLISFFGKLDNDICIIPAFINDQAENVEDLQTSKKLKEVNSIPVDAFRIGICNKLGARMSADLIPALLAMLCKANNNIHVLWLGADQTHSLYETIEVDLQRAGIREQVHLIPKINIDEAIFNSLDIFLLPSNDVNIPLLNLELGIRGIPFICFDSSEVAAEYIDAGLGRAVPYLDLNEMNEVTLSYFKNRNQLKNLKNSIKETSRKEFLTTAQAPKLWSLINSHFDENEIGPEERPTIAILTHIFYDNTWKDLKNKLSFFKDKGAQFLFSISEACLIKEELVEEIRTFFSNAYVLTTSNIGKDIGGKFALIDLYLSLELESDYVIFLHDKQSPHSLIGESWRNNLQKIVEFKNYNQIVRTFERDEKIGLIGAKEHLISEYDTTNNTFLNNNDKVHEFIKKYNISLSNYEFFGGTMYWMRTSILINFFKKYNPMEIRAELEVGNVLDNHGSTNAHTWERVLSWVASSQGYQLHGI